MSTGGAARTTSPDAPMTCASHPPRSAMALASNSALSSPSSASGSRPTAISHAIAAGDSRCGDRAAAGGPCVGAAVIDDPEV